MTTPTTPPAPVSARAAIELLGRRCALGHYPPQLENAVAVLLADHAELTARHTDRGHRFAKLYIRVETARTVCDESGRYVETVDVLRALDPRTERHEVAR